MIARPDVETLLAGPLGSWLEDQAKVRNAAQEKAVSRWWTAAMVGLPLLALLWILLPHLFQINLFITGVLAMAGFAWGNAPRNRAIKTVKVGINDAIAKALDLNYSIEVTNTEAFDLACTNKLLPNHDRSKFEDMWHGDIAGRSFSAHEALLRERRGSGKNRRYVTVFKGAIIAIDFTREFRSTTIVERASQHRTLLGLGRRKDSVTLNGRQLDYVDIVHPAFEDEFCVFSDDQVEARYLVHPQYVERLIAVQTAFDGQGIRAIFSGGDLVILVETENMFESGSMQASDDRVRIERTVEQFSSLANLAHSLNERDRAA